MDRKINSLWELFLEIATPNEYGYSREVTIAELLTINEAFKTNNGCSWARQDSGAASEYILIKKYGKNGTSKSGPVYSIQLNGFNKYKSNKNISSTILQDIKKKRCVVLDTANPECDHKNGKYNDKHVNEPSTQSIDDFQPLNRATNLAKREHCKKCNKTGKRYDAKRLGYNESFLYGNENSPNCEGCYWYDPREFNSTISQNYTKKF